MIKIDDDDDDDDDDNDDADDEDADDGADDDGDDDDDDGDDDGGGGNARTSESVDGRNPASLAYPVTHRVSMNSPSAHPIFNIGKGNGGRSLMQDFGTTTPLRYARR